MTGTGGGRVVITGASRGIGRAVARSLAHRGHDVDLWARDRARLDGVADGLACAGARVGCAVVDLGVEEQVRRATEDLDASPRPLTGLVLNAGAGRWASLEDVSSEAWRDSLRTNLDGPFHVLRALAPRLRRTPGALVVAVLSDSVLFPFPERSAYSAAKSGARALLEVFRREVRAAGVRVSCLFPSRVDTHFEGGRAGAEPGDRAGALEPATVGEVVATLYDLPAEVEVRDLSLSAMTSTFGPFPETREP